MTEGGPQDLRHVPVEHAAGREHEGDEGHGPDDQEDDADEGAGGLGRDTEVEAC